MQPMNDIASGRVGSMLNQPPSSQLSPESTNEMGWNVELLFAPLQMFGG